ncbi:hypothetical protein LCGC14_1352410 [marine sediment metagenome]|uniref:Uncharacterized protein n=1 Tax=marine sediment metagenome TaxID=412755 RepID=A0A0F9MR35_9ZZZZ
MEIDNSQDNNGELKEGLRNSDLLQVRAFLTCPAGDYKKTFRNQFLRKDIELMVVSLKIFDWMVCHHCGEILNLNLEFQI